MMLFSGTVEEELNESLRPGRCEADDITREEAPVTIKPRRRFRCRNYVVHLREMVVLSS